MTQAVQRLLDSLEKGSIYKDWSPQPTAAYATKEVASDEDSE